MRMRMGLTLVLVLFLVGMLSHSNSAYIPDTSEINRNSNQEVETPYSSGMNTNFVLSDTQKTGILDPLSVEQRGYVSTGSVSLRNDLSPKIENSLPIDTTHDWVGSMASANVTNLEKLYALNGTFDDGFPGLNLYPNGTVDYHPLGWAANSTDTTLYTDDVQSASYYSATDQYVKVESKGGKVGQDRYGHDVGTRVIWIQTVDNSPYTEDFELNFDYFYLRGPITGPGGDPLTGNCSLALFIDDVVVWNMSLLLLSQREFWYNTGNIPIHVSGVSSSFTLGIGLIIDEYIELDYVHDDYDGDGYIDGIENCAYITAFLDDISFLALTPPSPESVELAFYAGAGSNPIIGTSGSGSGAITNSSYWDTAILDVSFSTNTTISFTYVVTLLSHRYSNSSWTNEIESDGASFQVDYSNSAVIEAYTYLGSASEYSYKSLTFEYPSDWDNLTIYDPFLSNATDECIITSHNITIPDSLFSRLGWWRLTADSPNYLKDMTTQISGPFTSDWVNGTLFRSSNYSRVSLEVGTNIEHPSSLTQVEISWVMPNGTQWFFESLNSVSGNIINTSSVVLGSDNTTAGVWNVIIFWENGTEIAYDITNFEIHHQSQLVAENVLIETEQGSIITNMVRFEDIETMDYIMDTDTIVVANWSSTTITFQPNPVHNWWEANFNTSDLGGGEFLIQVNASSTYYDFASCNFSIRSILTDNVLNIAISTGRVSLLENYSAEFTYKDKFGVGIESAQISISYNGPSGGLDWGSVQDLGSGIYRMNFSASISGSYTITINANRTYYETSRDILLLDVGTLMATLSSENGSIASTEFGPSYRLVIRYVNGTGHGLSGANVSVLDTVPASGISCTIPEDLGDGYYSTIISTTEATTFTILLEAVITNHDRAVFTFTISVTDISTILTIESSSDSIAIDQNTNITLRYTNETDYGITGATVVVISPPAGLSFSSVTDLGNGYYQVTVTPVEPGEYQIRFKASASNHLDATAAVALSVAQIRTNLRVETPLSEYSVQYGGILEIQLIFERLDTSGVAISNISGALFYVDIPEGSGVVYSINPEIIHEGHYLLRLWGDSIGTWEITIKANKTQHETSTLIIPFRLERVITDINEFDSRTYIYGRTYSLTYVYTFSSNGSLIQGANLIISGHGSDFITWEEDSAGYIITLIPLDTGSFSISIDFTKEGHQTQSTTLQFEVNDVPILISGDTTVIWDQYFDLPINVSITVTDTHEQVTDAVVVLILYSGNVIIDEFPLSHYTAGLYNGTIPQGYWEDPDMTIKVEVQRENSLATDFEIDVRTAPATPATMIIRNSIPITAFSIIVIVSLLSIRYSRKRQARLRKEATDVKATFDDANNLLGILVLHKNSGLPFYSKILKGGFEEGMLSAFVTAVTHFRSEFENNGAEREWKLTPISDIIRAGPTKNLICAFVTMTSPSLVHEAKMLMFTRDIGLLLDDRMEVPPTEFRDDTTGQMIEDLFDDHLDGALLKVYRFSVEGALPRRYRKLSDARSVAGLGDTFSLTELNRGLEAMGIEEAQGFKMIFDAVEDGQLWPIDRDEDHLPPFSS